jgi:hypothetical protein
VTDTLGYALRYAQRGFSVIPLKPDSKRPALASWTRYQTEHASTRQLKAWFGNGNPKQHGVGVVTGAVSGLVVLDIDPGGSVPVVLPRTYRVITPRGQHMYFRWPGEPVLNKVALFPNVDLRGDGGYVVAPPSVIGGKGYVPDGVLSHMFAALPVELLALARARSTPKNAFDLVPALSTHVSVLLTLLEPLQSTPYGLKALEGTRRELLSSTVGRRNLDLFKAACRMGELVAGSELKRATVFHTLRKAALEVGLDPEEISPTIRSGLDRGAQRPRSAPKRP